VFSAVTKLTLVTSFRFVTIGMTLESSPTDVGRFELMLLVFQNQWLAPPSTQLEDPLVLDLIFILISISNIVFSNSRRQYLTIQSRPG
jgi:hypothetical protein